MIIVQGENPGEMLIDQAQLAVVTQAYGQQFRIPESQGGFDIVLRVLPDYTQIISGEESVLLAAAELIVFICKADGRILINIDIALILRHCQEEGMPGSERVVRKGIPLYTADNHQRAVRSGIHARLRAVHSCPHFPEPAAGKGKKRHQGQ